MDVRTCKNCRKLFNYLSGPPICPTCARKLEEKFQEVKTYIEDNEGASIDEVSKECDVSAQQIKRWIKEERLVMKSASGEVMECEKCGKPILTGRFCDACKKELVGEMDKSIAKPKAAVEHVKKTKDKERMRFLEK